jgi:peptidyl-prolyl isomerase D
VYGGQFKDDKGGLQLKHTHKGSLSMANMGHDTNTNHFSIMMGPAPHLNGDYTIFGQVVTGFEVVDAINALSIGKPENTATAEDGAVIADCGQIRKGTIVPNLDQE